MGTGLPPLPPLPAWEGATPGGPGCAGEPGGPPRDPPPLPDLSGARSFHVIGVGGTGMGTFAGMLKAAGYAVTGSDEAVYPPMSDLLAGWGIEVREPYHADNLPAGCDVFVIGNVCRRDNPEAAEVRERGLPAVSFPAALAGLFLQGRHSVVVAGTHGKTTTASLLGHALVTAGKDPGILVGGLSADLGGSFRLGAGPVFVVEGDEYDSAYFDKGPKLFHYQARSAILTNVEFDHADIYADLAQVEYAFARFVAMIPEDGIVCYCSDDPGARRVARTHARCRLRSYGLSEDADVRAADVAWPDGGAAFDLVADGRRLARVRSPLTGLHNLRNALGVAACALDLGLSPDEVAAGVAAFSGVAKRQTVVGEAAGVTVVDDFAHHPTAVRETLAALRLRYPAARLLVAFEAKSNTSRMNVFHDAYVEALGRADLVVIARPYVKRDAIPKHRRLDVEALAADLRSRGVQAHLIPDADDIASFLADAARPGDVVAGLSGSAFSGLHRKALQRLAATAVAGGAQ